MYETQYKLQKLRASQRNIGWMFTYATWLEWWGDDIEKRGRHRDDLCMARYGDVGPYSPDNCFKQTMRQNLDEAMARKPKKGRAKQKYKHRPSKRQLFIGPLIPKYRFVTPEGIFRSVPHAAEHYGIDRSSMRERAKWNPDKYYFMDFIPKRV